MPYRRMIAAALTVWLAVGCTHASLGSSMPASDVRGNGGEWVSMIDPTLSAWRGYRKEVMPSGWRVVEGVLVKEGVVEDLISREQFGDFELAFDWKVAPGGNAGVFYHATEQYDKIYWSGTEYQLLDDARHPDGRNPLTSAGAAYGLFPPPAGVVRPAEEWNSSRIVARGTHVEHWLNGQKLLEYEARGPEWTARVAASKFHAYPAYGLATRGHIGLQGDHAGALAIRDLRIRVLP